MREGSLVPTNLLNWPRIAPMLPELKLIILALWASPYMSCAGAGLVPLRPFASSLGLSPESLHSGLSSLEDLGLIAQDPGTGEIFIMDWFRFHSFNNGKAIGMLRAAISKIESEQLKLLVESRAPAGEAAQTRPGRRQDDAIDEATGAILASADDRTRLDALIKKHGADAVRDAAASVRESGGRVFVSSLHSALNKKRNGRELREEDVGCGRSGKLTDLDRAPVSIL